MSAKVFAKIAPQFYRAKYPVIPMRSNAKSPAIKSHPSYQDNFPNAQRRADWIEKFTDCNIAVVTGKKLPDGTRFAVLDVDQDKYVRVFKTLVPGNPPIRFGSKGCAIFIRVPDGISSYTRKDAEGNIAYELLGLGGRLALLPPSIHPKTGNEYIWTSDTRLDEVPMEELPFVSEDILKFINFLMSRTETIQLTLGSPSHEAARDLMAGGTAFLTDKETACKAIAALLPENYNGNVIEELPGLYETAKEKGLGKNILRLEYDPGENGPRPLGCSKSGDYIFFDPRLNMVKRKTARQLSSPQDLRDLAPMAFWRRIAPTDKGYDAAKIGDMLTEACIKAGRFDPTKVRGVGVWHEAGQIKQNVYGPLPESNKYLYSRSDDFGELHGKPIEASKIYEWLQKFNWQHPEFATVIFGWAVIAPIAGALPSRPHVFLSGAKGTGKSTCIEGISALLDPLNHQQDGSTSTEAGIRQKLSENAIPIIIDEFEQTENRQQRRIINLARSAYTANATGAKGTPSGNHLEFLITTTFLFAGVRVVRFNSTDRSRIFVIEMLPHNSDEEISKEIDAMVQKHQSHQVDWCKQQIEQTQNILKTIILFRAEMPPIDARAKQNLSIILAGAFVGLNKRTPKRREVKEWILKNETLITLHTETQENDDPADCLNWLLSHRKDRDLSNWDLILKSIDAHKGVGNILNEASVIEAFGLRVQEGLLWVSKNHAYLYTVFRDSKWADGAWSGSLSRIEGAVEGKKYFQGQQQRAVGIPLVMFNTPRQDKE